MATGIIDAMKIFRIGYSINAWLWLTAIIIVWFLKDQLEQAIRNIVPYININYTLYFIMFWSFFSVALDFAFLWYVYKTEMRSEGSSSDE